MTEDEKMPFLILKGFVPTKRRVTSGPNGSIVMSALIENPKPGEMTWIRGDDLFEFDQAYEEACK